MHLLLTRPEPDATRSAALLRARGHDVLLAPMLRIVPVADLQIGDGPWSAILMTSANAARAIGAHPRSAELLARPVLAVGPQTAAAAREAGFRDVRASTGNADDLLRLAERECVPGGDPMLYLAGEERARDLRPALAAARLRLEEVVVYRAEAAQAFPEAVKAALRGGALAGILHYSRRSAETFLACATDAGLRSEALAHVQYCLSEAVAAPLADAGAKRLFVAPRPQEAALFALLDG